VWLVILKKLGLAALVPQSAATPFCSWWHDVIRNIPKDRKKGLNSSLWLGRPGNIVMLVFEVLGAVANWCISSP